MALDLSSSALLNAAGGGLFALAGLGALTVARRGRRAVLVGLHATTFGALYVVSNIVLPGPGSNLLLVGAGLVVLAVAAALAADLARGLTPSARRLLAWTLPPLLAVVTASVVTHFFLLDEAAASFRGPPTLATSIIAASVIAAEGALTVLHVVAIVRYRASAPEAGAERRAMLLLATSTGLFTTFLLASGYPLGSSAVTGWAYWTGFFVPAVVLSATSPLLLVPTRRVPEPRLALRALFALVAAGLVAAALVASPWGPLVAELGPYGIVRTIGAALLVLAIVKYDLLGVPLPRVAVRRGPLAAAALAILFVVAQVAQNFLAAQYGLLMGGIVAGAFLFAAQPLQRAFEGRSNAPPRAPTDAARREVAYLGACRLAMRDRRLTREEEARLNLLADELGLTPSRAHELLVQAEREAGVA